jgi:hypothetical protein
VPLASGSAPDTVHLFCRSRGKAHEMQSTIAALGDVSGFSVGFGSLASGLPRVLHGPLLAGKPRGDRRDADQAVSPRLRCRGVVLLGPQQLYERYYSGDPVRLAGTLYGLYDKET